MYVCGIVLIPILISVLNEQIRNIKKVSVDSYITQKLSHSNSHCNIRENKC